MSSQSAKSRSEALSGFGAAETSSSENACSLFPFWTNCKLLISDTVSLAYKIVIQYKKLIAYSLY